MIFEFSGYRPYLKRYLAGRPNKGFGEATKIAAALSVSSTYVSHVLSGKKDLSLEQAAVLSDYLGHSELEIEYFHYLVQLERAGNPRLRSFCEKKLAELKARSQQVAERIAFKKTLTEEERSVFYSSALYSSVHLFTSIRESGVTLEEIAERFELSRKRASAIIHFLVETSLCIEAGDRYKMGTQSTHVEAASPHALKHHANWRVRAIQASESLGDDELMYTVQVSLSKDDFRKLREKMVQDIKSFLETVYPSPSEEIACFNLDWFWIRK